MIHVHSLWLLFFTIAATRAFPDGPPLSACYDMKPGTRIGSLGEEGHVQQPQNDHPTHGYSKIGPFYIEIHEEDYEYEPNQQIEVSLVANQTHGANRFKGVLLQARKVICVDGSTVKVEDDPLGRFQLPPSSETLLKTMDCEDFDDSAVAHKTPQFKIREKSTWIAPSRQGHIVFRATFVSEAYIYWTDVYSAILRDTESNPPPTCGSPYLVANITWLLLLLTLNFIFK